MVKIKKIFSEFMEGSKIFGELISAFINFLLLSFVYFIGIGLTSMFAKILRKRFIDENMNKKSYWEELNLTTKSVKEYYRQF
jgi:large-conductance mechanosensitive channel